MAKPVAQEPMPFDIALEARNAWSSAMYNECVALLAGRRDPTSRLLLARSYLRMKRLEAAEESLKGFRSENAVQAAEVAVLRAYLDDRLHGKDRPVAESSIVNVTLPPGSAAFAKDLAAFYRGSFYWLRGLTANAAAEAVRSSSASDPLLRAWSLDLQALIFTSELKFRHALDKFVDALDQFAQSPVRDEHKRVGTLHGLALTSVETLHPSTFPRMYAEAQNLPRSPYAVRLTTQSLTYCALAKMIDGEDESAFEYLMKAASLPTPDPFGALPHVELASFHRRRGSLDAARLHLNVANGVLDRTNWSTADDEASLILLLYAAYAASIDVSSASRAFSRALNLTGKKDPTLAFEHGGRGLAMALYARGRIEYAKDSESVEAIEDLIRAKNLWAQLGYQYRELIVSIDLVGTGEPFRFAGLSVARKAAPKAWFWEQLREQKRQAASPLRDVSPAEQLVLNGICEGLTSKEIATKLGRSPSTVRNQTISLFRLFGVGTRTALVALVLDAQS